MRSKHFRNKARRSFWSVHIESWHRSGLTRTAYCREHALNNCTFDRWMKALNVMKLHEIEQRAARKALHKRTRQPIGAKDKHNRAVQAFWAMHVEAMDWCGLTTREYAAAHRLSWWSLQTWRKRLATGEFEIDWRAHLHPSARPVVSSDVSSAAKARPVENGLTDTASAAPARDGRSNRRNFTLAEKYAIVMEAEQPGVSAAAVCRRHNIATSMIFRWRAQFGVGQEKRSELAEVRICGEQLGDKPTAAGAALDLQSILPKPDGMEVVELTDGRKVFAPMGVDPDAVRKHVAEREKSG